MKLVSSLSLFIALVPAMAQVKITQGDNQVTVSVDRQPFSTFFYGPSVTKPYLYPLRLPSGEIVTREWPMEDRAGERHDHIHHRGVWFAHSNVNGIDFWNSDPSYHTPHMGHIVVKSIGDIQNGKSAGAFHASLEWDDPSGKTLLREERTTTFHSGSPRLIDFDFLLTAVVPVKCGDDKDGVFGLRLAPELEEPLKDSPPSPARTGVMTGSNGCHMEAQCWGSRGNWIDMSGQLGKEAGGIAIFDYPANPRHPTYWHVRGYGLLAANIFGVKAFTHNPSADGSMSLQTGDQLRFRYRLVVHPGDAASADLGHLYAAYAEGATGPLR